MAAFQKCLPARKCKQDKGSICMLTMFNMYKKLWKTNWLTPYSSMFVGLSQACPILRTACHAGPRMANPSWDCQYNHTLELNTRRALNKATNTKFLNANVKKYYAQEAEQKRTRIYQCNIHTVITASNFDSVKQPL